MLLADGAWLVGLGAACAGVGSLLSGLAAFRIAGHKHEDTPPVGSGSEPAGSGTTGGSSSEQLGGEPSED